MVEILVFHGLLAGVILALRTRLGRWAFALGAAGPAAVLAWSIANGGPILDGTPVETTFEWVPSMDLVFHLRIDGYALAFLLIVGALGTAIFGYAAAYFGSNPRSATSAAVMTLFSGSMTGLVVSDHLLALFVFWELTTITSYLLIGHSDHDPNARTSALHAAMITGAGGLALLAGLVVIGVESGTYLISELTPAGGSALTLAWFLVLAGALTKSAQFPFHGWLPGAMAAPTPVSAFLHSATMVKAGIFLVGRLGPLAAVDWWQPTVFVFGLLTMVVGGWQALRQVDLKLLLAYGTVSQLGFLFMLVGSGDASLVFGGLALVIAHALFKATLFMVVGTIDHEAGTRDLRRLSGLRSSMPGIFWISIIASATMAAIPLTFGFAAKEAAFDALVSAGTASIAAAAIASTLTVAYTARFLRGAFGPAHEGHEVATVPADSRAGALLWIPGVVALAMVFLGVFPEAAASLTKAATADATGVVPEGKLVIWPGFVPALAWSMASLVVGLFLAWRERMLDAAIAGVRRVTSAIPASGDLFRRSISDLLTFADTTSGLLQSGSLPRYLGIILATAVIMPTTALVGIELPDTLPRLGSPLEILLAAIICAAGIGVAFTSRRFAAVLLMGGVGYGVAGLFATIGGPDLSITQLLVETLAVALFALVLRHLPTTFRSRTSERPFKIAVSVAVALFVFGAGLLASTSRVAEPISDQQVELSVPVAQGANVVNVILVDFRALDTLGEITVLVAATLGAAGLVLPVIRERIGNRR